MTHIILVAIILTAIFYGTFLFISERTLNTPPANNPKVFLKNNPNPSERKTLVTIGDSITHGVVSANYSDMVAQKITQYGYETINAGMNADLAYTVTKRIDDIVACQPKIATILIGTNDVIASFEGRLENYWKIKRLPEGQEVSLDFYTKHLKIIIDKLQTVPDIKIFILSPPVLGEELDSIQNQKVALYSSSIKEIAQEKQITYIPLHEHMISLLQENPSPNKTKFGNERLALSLAVVKHNFLGISWNQIAQDNGLTLTTETIHLNETAAELVSELILQHIEPFLSEAKN